MPRALPAAALAAAGLARRAGVSNKAQAQRLLGFSGGFEELAVTITKKLNDWQVDMDHQDHVNLLRYGVPAPGGVWADFGSGWGAFTLALADLVGPLGEIYSIDKDRSALKDQERAMQMRFPDRGPAVTHYLVADFTQPIELPQLDGAVMANALHFQRQNEKVLVLELLYHYLRPGGRFILVEYNIDRGNPWVPYPISYPHWQVLAQESGFTGTQQLATRPSRTFHQIYSAVSFKPISGPLLSGWSDPR